MSTTVSARPFFSGCCLSAGDRATTEYSHVPRASPLATSCGVPESSCGFPAGRSTRRSFFQFLKTSNVKVHLQRCCHLNLGTVDVGTLRKIRRHPELLSLFPLAPRRQNFQRAFAQQILNLCSVLFADLLKGRDVAAIIDSQISAQEHRQAVCPHVFDDVIHDIVPFAVISLPAFHQHKTCCLYVFDDVALLRRTREA